MDLFKNDTLTPLLIFKGPKFDEGESPPEFQLYKVKADSFDDALKVIKTYAKNDNLGSPREEGKFRLKCSKTKKCTRLKFMWSGYGDQWLAWYFLAENANGIFLFRYEYWATYKQLEKKVMDSAKSFKFVKKPKKKEGEEDKPVKKAASPWLEGSRDQCISCAIQTSPISQRLRNMPLF